MGDEWEIGDPVDDSNGGTMDAMNWGHGSDDEDDDENRWIGRDFPDSRIEEYGKKAWDYYMEFKEEEALYYINLALDLNDRHANNWNRKAIILEGMKRYAESEECYNRSLELSPQNLVYDNKARMLLAWSHQLLDESKELPNGLSKLKEAEKKIVKAMNALSADSDEDINKYLRMRDSINFYIDYEKKFQSNLESLKQYDKSELFTITGRQFYRKR